LAISEEDKNKIETLVKEVGDLNNIDLILPNDPIFYGDYEWNFPPDKEIAFKIIKLDNDGKVHLNLGYLVLSRKDLQQLAYSEIFKNNILRPKILELLPPEEPSS